MSQAKARSRQRGTALMETLMVNVVLIPLLAAVVFFQATYSAKIRSLQNARAYAWTYAFGGCDDVPTDEALAIQEGFGKPDSSEEPPDGDLQNELGQSGNSVPDTGTELDNDSNYTDNVFGTGTGAAGAKVGTVNATSSVHMAAFNVLKVGAHVMTSSEHVICNPTPVNGNQVGNVAVQSARNLGNWLIGL